MKYLRRAGLFMAFFAVISALVLSTGLTSKVSAAGEKYEFKDASTIIGSGGDYDSNREFKKQSGGKYVSPASQCNRGVCNNPELTISDLQKNSGDRGYSADLAQTSGGDKNLGTITISDPKAVGPNGGAPNPIQNSDGSTGDEPSCEDNGGPLAWFLCPVTSTLDGIIGFLDGEIQERLLIDDSKYNNDSIRQVWAVIRNVAFLILVPIMLVMVIGTALDFGPFDAYTVKKALPRMFAAVIFIALSLPICQFFINLANIAGTGILGLMTFPFEGNQITLESLYDSGGDLGLLALGAGGLFLGIAAGGVTIGIVLSYAIVFMIALLIAYLVLLLRELVILFLIIIAPLAILVWIFPGNDKPWKLWRGAFINLLIMFPLIMALIAAGRIMAEVIDTTQGNTAALFLKLTAYILPYFFIPATFKVAGGLFATVAGIANDRSRGVFDRQRKYRQETRAERRQRAQSQSLFDNNSRVGKQVNKVGSWLTGPGDNLAYSARNVPGFKKRGTNVAYQIQQARVEQSGKLFEELNKHGYNDAAYRALSGAHDELKGNVVDAEGNLVTDSEGNAVTVKDRLKEADLFGRAPQSIGELQTMSNILSQSDNPNNRLASNAINSSAGRLAALYQDPEMTKASVQAAGIMGLSAHGFADTRDLSKVGNDLMGGERDNAGFAQAVVSQAQLLGMRSRPDIKPGYGVLYDAKDGKFIDGMASIEDGGGGRASAVLKTFSSQDLAGAKSGAIERLKPTITRTIDEGGGAAQAQKDQLFSWAGPYSQASAGVKEEALNIILETNPDTGAYVRPDLVRDFETYRRMDIDPSLRGGGGGGEPPQQTGGAGPGGQ